MARPPHIRVSFLGGYGSTGAISEEWGFSFNLIAPAVNTIAGLNVLATAANDAMALHLRPVCAPHIIFRGVKTAAITSDGTYATTTGGTYLAGESFTGLYAGSSSAYTTRMPNSVALAVSLVTPRSGPTGKGRVFLPWPGIGLDNDGRIVELAATNVANAMVNLIDKVNDASAPNAVSVVSTKDYATSVTGVRVGRVPDTMRSRRRSLLEGYVAVNL